MSKNSNGRPADASIIEPRGSRKRTSKPPPPPAESRVKTHWIEVRRKRACLGGGFAGWIDLERCKCICEGPGDGIESDWQALYGTPGGCFLVAFFIARDNPIDEDGQVESYAFFITKLQALGWFADDRETALARLGALVEEFDLTEFPAAVSAAELVAAAPSKNGRATGGDRTAATNGRPIEAPADHPELVAAPPSGNGTVATNGRAGGNAKRPSGAALPAIGRAARERILKFFHENLNQAWKTLDEITRGVGSNSEKYTSTRLRELVKANVLEHQKGDGLWRLK